MAAVKFLLKFEPLLHLVDRSGYSAIRWAVIHANQPLVRLLLEHGAAITKVGVSHNEHENHTDNKIVHRTATRLTVRLKLH